MKVTFKPLERINISAVICTHLIGKQHTDEHRKFAGLVIMAAGIGVVHAAGMINSEIIHFIGEVAGAGIHGVGLIPWISKLEG